MLLAPTRASCHNVGTGGHGVRFCNSNYSGGTGGGTGSGLAIVVIRAHSPLARSEMSGGCAGSGPELSV
jgi:hypothetical protein